MKQGIQTCFSCEWGGLGSWMDTLIVFHSPNRKQKTTECLSWILTALKLIFCCLSYHLSEQVVVKMIWMKCQLRGGYRLSAETRARTIHAAWGWWFLWVVLRCLNGNRIPSKLSTKGLLGWFGRDYEVMIRGEKVILKGFIGGIVGIMNHESFVTYLI